MESAAASQRKTAPRSGQRPFQLKEPQLRAYLASLKEEGRAKSTLQRYRTALNQFYQFLGPEKWVYAHSLPQWQESLLAQGYADRSVNSCLATINGLYGYLGCWEWQVFDWREPPQAQGPELTRQEYLTLLEEARRQENIQLYLLTKVMATTDLTPGDMPLLTREAVNDGLITGKTRGAQGTVELPGCLRQDLLEYALQHGIRSGPLFLSANRKCLDRTVISRQIALLGEAAGLEPGKANPRNLRKLHLTTLERYRKQAEEWVRSSYDALLDQEEAAAAWYTRPITTESFRTKAGE